MAKQSRKRPFEELKLEYTEVNQNIRHYSNLRFTIFAVYFAILSAVVIFAFGDNQFFLAAPKVASVLGLLITLFFWYYQVRASQFYEYFSSRGRELEQLLGFQQITKRPVPNLRLFYFHMVTNIFFAILSSFWLFVIFAS
jgi:hypothetical protein